MSQYRSDRYRVQKRIFHPALRWMAATLDGRVEANRAAFETKFMLPWYFSDEAAVEKYTPQLHHNVWVVAARGAVLSIITGCGKWVKINVHADPINLQLIVTAERKFRRCVEGGEPPILFGVDPPKPWIEAVRIGITTRCREGAKRPRVQHKRSST
jgi:hypothetical protein